MTQLPWLEPGSTDFPSTRLALTDPNGLLAVGGDLSPAQLLAAYQRGIFPWFDESQPILWWSPSPRLVLKPSELHISKSMRKLLRKAPFRVTTDTAFEEVIESCAEPRDDQDGTWITEEMQAAYIHLHQLGFAHSVEVWDGEDLIGGLYGIALGKVFFGESMFSRASNASKYGFITLIQALDALNFGIIDCQVHTHHLSSLGAREVSRKTFEEYLVSYINRDTINRDSINRDSINKDTDRTQDTGIPENNTFETPYNIDALKARWPATLLSDSST
ncbi:leucyl/phenylalanyl-tRNA--protein transferase [Pseudomaricurvus sp.]|uniref:leucyl/phenylalanyl-tRNA--protein transferase n=1 Tax=Pseudomaricurvus sp. TaxID=2004510 RepID=UPI003F6D5683